MQIAVVGATGNIGTAVLDALVADPAVEHVRAVARRTPAGSREKVSFFALDVTADDLEPAFAGADAVVHLGWLFQPTHRPTITWGVNVGGSARVFDAAARHRVGALVVASSVGAYGPGPGRTVDESWPTDGLPTAGYGREKAYVERLLDAFEARHPEVRVVRMRPGFVFQRAAASQQRRLFAGPFVPTALLRPGVLPMLPFPRGLTFQAVHAHDVADAFRLALHDGGACGAYNLAADPVVDGPAIASLLGSRLIEVPPGLVRAALAAAWHARLAPAEPALFDLAMGLPTMSTERARRELGWAPRTTAIDALREGLEGMAAGAGGGTPPLGADSGEAGWPRSRTESVGALKPR